jgi:preprotein translocase SecE subunit
MIAIFNIYKKGQGKYSRGLGILGIGSLAIFGCVSLYNALLFEPYDKSLYKIPGVDLDVTWALIIMVALALLSIGGLYWLNNKRKIVDFLIETEGELRKVTWPSRNEVVDSSLVVVVTVVIMAAFIFLADIVLKTILHDYIYKL